MTLPEVEELIGYWSEFPPAHILLRGFVGFKGEKKRGPAEAPPPMSFEEMAAFVAQAKGG